MKTGLRLLRDSQSSSKDIRQTHPPIFLEGALMARLGNGRMRCKTFLPPFIWIQWQQRLITNEDVYFESSIPENLFRICQSLFCWTILPTTMRLIFIADFFTT